MTCINKATEGAIAHARIVAPAGLHRDKHNWWQQIEATYGATRELVVDNGRETLGADLMTALADLGVTVKVRPAFAPGYKPTAEPLLRQLKATAHEAP